MLRAAAHVIERKIIMRVVSPRSCACIPPIDEQCRNVSDASVCFILSQPAINDNSSSKKAQCERVKDKDSHRTPARKPEINRRCSHMGEPVGST